MADKRISELNSITGANTADGDLFVIVDVDASETKKITKSELFNQDITIGGTVTADGVSLGDNEKAQFGASNDLQIYHDGTDSIILDDGTGNLRLLCENFRLQDTNESETYITADKDGAVGLRFNDSEKLATTATGIDVTGTVTADGLTVNTGSEGVYATLGSTGNTSRDLSLQSYTAGAVSGAGHLINAPSTQGQIKIQTNDTDRILVGKQGDISFYEDTGATPKLFWDASAESLGIGTTSPSHKLVVSNGGAEGLEFNWSSGQSTNFIQSYNRSTSSYLPVTYYASEQIFTSGTGATERMRIDSSGNLDMTAGGGNIIMASGAGIDFSATANGSGTTSSELLDDYEEGTFTPSVAFNGNSVGVTYDFQEGAYRKVGSLVYCIGHLTLTNNGSSTGVASITGLPFTIANLLPQTAVEGGGAMPLFTGAGNNVSGFLLTGDNSSTTAAIRIFPASGTSTVNADESDITNNFACRFYITYIAT